MDPTIGRSVYFYENRGARPKVALVCDVREIVPKHFVVNLAVFDHNGDSKPKTGVIFVQPDEGLMDGSRSYAAWMPYQASNSQNDLLTLSKRIQAIEALKLDAQLTNSVSLELLDKKLNERLNELEARFVKPNINPAPVSTNAYTPPGVPAK
jgi:hypothetical protein